MSNTDIFLDKYKQLEVAVRYTYKLDKYASAIAFLKKQRSYQKYISEIELCADVRNLLSHNPKVNGNYAVEPSGKLLEFMDFLIDSVRNRVRCADIAIKFKSISRSTMNGRVRDAVETMKLTHRSHIPIVGNHRVLGIFDENVLFSILAGEGISVLSDNPNLKFSDVQKYISLEDKGSKKYIFVPASMDIDELQDLFDRYYLEKKRVGLVFVTKNGREDEPLMGLLTPWDVISARSRM